MSYRVPLHINTNNNCCYGYLCTHHGVDCINFATRLHARLAIHKYTIRFGKKLIYKIIKV